MISRYLWQGITMDKIRSVEQVQEIIKCQFICMLNNYFYWDLNHMISNGMYLSKVT